jgi:hypothetical protein
MAGPKTFRPAAREAAQPLLIEMRKYHITSVVDPDPAGEAWQLEIWVKAGPRASAQTGFRR